MISSGPPELAELLAALRADGLPLGPQELIRLHQAFAGAPRLDRPGLKRFLACLLVKTSEQQALFAQRFDGWCPDRPAAWEAEPAPAPARAASVAPLATFADEPFEPLLLGPTARPWLPAVGLCTALLLVAGIVYLVRPPQIGPEGPPVERPAVTLPHIHEEQDALPANPAPQVWYWQARIPPAGIVVPFRLQPRELALVALLAGLAAGALWWRYRRRLPPPPWLPPTGDGPAWLPLPPVTGSDTTLLGPRERRTLVWNIGRFAGEDLTRRLDQPATAAATARAAGRAELRYRHARFPREVWLWLDSHCLDPTLAPLAGEIATSLGRAGLGVRRGSFAGTPLRVWWRRDDHCEPTRLEGHREHAMVALLTDGAGLARALEAPLHSRRVTRLLRQLRLWPHLVLVDFGPPGRLARRLRPFGLAVIPPQALAGWLGGQASGPALQGDLRLWAAACCLGADPLDAASA